MSNIQSFLDKTGVSTLWSQISLEIANKVAAEKTRAEQAEGQLSTNLSNLTTYVGTIPATYAESNIVSYINKKAEETLNAASGGSSESAASVLAALNTYKTENDPKVDANAKAIADVVADYLKAADKTELANNIAANAGEITRIDNALKAAVENNGEGLDSIKELATWIETHGVEAAGYAAAIDALEALVGDTAVATQIANAIAAENLAQYATNADLTTLANKVDTGDKTVTAAINAAIEALKIGDYAKAADLTDLAARVSVLEGAGYQNATQVNAAIEAKITALNLGNTYEAKGAAATALASAMTYTDTELAKIQPLTEGEIKEAIGKA
jgi:hypothetical protein